MARHKVTRGEAPIRVLIVDDHPIVREGLVSVLARQEGIEIAGQAADGHSALRAWEALRPDITIVDLQMPQPDGVTLVEILRSRHERARLIIFTSYDRDQDVARALQAGASGYLLKDATQAELLHCIRRVHGGFRHIAPSAASRLADWIQGETFTRREMQILKLLGHARSNKDMADALGIAEGTVKAHMKSVLGKLGATSRSEALLIAVKRGLITPESAP